MAVQSSSTRAFRTFAPRTRFPECGASSAFGVGGVFLIGAGSLLLGALLMCVANAALPAFFRPGREVAPTTLDLLEPVE